MISNRATKTNALQWYGPVFTNQLHFNRMQQRKTTIKRAESFTTEHSTVKQPEHIGRTFLIWKTALTTWKTCRQTKQIPRISAAMNPLSSFHLKLFLRSGDNLLIVIVTNNFLNTLSFSQSVFTAIVSQVVTSRCAARDPWRHLILSTRKNYVSVFPK